MLCCYDDGGDMKEFPDENHSKSKMQGCNKAPENVQKKVEE